MSKRMRQFYRAVAGAGLALGIAACAEVGPNYQRPQMTVPGAFKEASGAAAGPRLDVRWWRLFGDEGLTQLENAAVQGSPTLAAAMARVTEARALSESVASQFYPTVTADPSATRSRTSGGNGKASSTGNNFTLPLDLTYEVDVWGRVRRSHENTEAGARAAEDDYEVVVQTLMTDVATDYFELRGLDAQATILEESVKLYGDQIDLTNRQLKAGIVGELDLAQAQTLLSSAQAALTEVQRQRADLEHAIAVLTGRPPSSLKIWENPLTGEPPAVPAGLPSELLRRRPDVAEAEENLQAANASVGVAAANFYPVFRLTGAAGYESVDLQHLLDWESRFWSLGPSVSIPLFEGGKLTADLQQAKARYEELSAVYQGAVLTAFADVENSLTDLHKRADSVRQLGQAAGFADEAKRLAQVRYDKGVDNYLQVIDAERTLLDNRLALVQTNTLRYVSTVLLIKAMGGGWEDDALKEATTQPGLVKEMEIPAGTPAATMPGQ